MKLKRNILIIDDDSTNIFALRLSLRSKGYDVLSAQSALEGIEMIREDKSIAIVLMDMMMPDIEGYQALEMLQQQPPEPNIPVIAVTAQAMLGDREKCLKAGAIDYVSKPIDIDVLVKSIEKWSPQ